MQGPTGPVSLELEQGPSGGRHQHELRFQVTALTEGTPLHFKVIGSGIDPEPQVQWDAKSGTGVVILGVHRDMATGQHAGWVEISACLDPSCVQMIQGSRSRIPLDVRITPRFAVSEQAVAFQLSPGQAATSRRVSVTLPAKASAWSHELKLSQPTPDWLLSRQEGSDLVITPAPGLAPGRYSATLHVSPQGTGHPPLTVDVSASVDQAVALADSRSWQVRSRTSPEGLTAALSVLATPATPAGLTWEAQSQVPWLKASVASGKAGEAIVLSLDPAGFSALANQAVHEGQVRVRFSHGLPERQVTIRLDKQMAQVLQVEDTGLLASERGVSTQGVMELRGVNLRDIAGQPRQFLRFAGIQPIAITVVDSQRVVVQLPSMPAGTYQGQLLSASGLPAQTFSFQFR